MFLHQLDARTAVIATRRYMPEMLAADEGTGPLPVIVAALPRSAPVMAAAAVEPARRQLNQAVYEIRNQLPLPLDGTARVPELLDSLVVAAGVSPEHPIRLTMTGRDDASAAELEKIVTDVLPFVRDLAVARIAEQFEGDDRVSEAIRSYTERSASEIVTMLTPHRKRRQLLVEIESREKLATAGVMVTCLLPTVQAWTEAAERRRGAGDLEQIVVALHRYWGMFDHLPDPAIRDTDGNPLLSWRVAILPFLGQGELYDQFRLDEPWDSEHNLKLIDRIPAVYKDRSANTPPGMTIYQAVVGERFVFMPQGTRRFQEVSDGISSTIAIVEVDVAHAVPWTKPRDVEIDVEHPLRKMGKHRQDGFLVAYLNGSIRFVKATASAASVDPEAFFANLTRSGGEPIPKVGDPVDGGRLPNR